MKKKRNGSKAAKKKSSFFFKFSCVKISASSFIFSLFLAFYPDFTVFFLIFCTWYLTPLSIALSFFGKRL